VIIVYEQLFKYNNDGRYVKINNCVQPISTL